MSHDDARAVPDPASGLTFWKWACVRAAGFPGAMALRLAADDAAQAVDAVARADEDLARARAAALTALGDGGALDEATIDRRRRARKALRKDRTPAAEDIAGLDPAPFAAHAAAVVEATALRAALPAAYDAARRVVSESVRQIAAEPRFREAVTWQNRRAVKTALDALARRSAGGAVDSKTRQHEELVASYVHRYATKNDTIGFFGPVGWARFDEAETERIRVRPGPTLLAQRTTYLEQWAIDAVAAGASRDARLWPWIRPRTYGFLQLDGARLESPLTGTRTLEPALAEVLRACDGNRTTRELAIRLTSDGTLPSAEAVDGALRALGEQRLVALGFESGTTWTPAADLRRTLAAVDDAALRDEWLAVLDELEAARADVAAAAGDPARLDVALEQLEATFHRLTGMAPTRHAGAMYASRSLSFEDARRDLDVVLGSRLRDDLAPVLDLLVTSARHLTFEVARAYEHALRAIFVAASARRGTPAVPLADVWYRAQALFHGAKERPLDAVVDRVRAAWSELLAVDPDARRVTRSSAELAPRVREVFAAPRPGWVDARRHSPDVMIAAPSPESIQRGAYLAVLGEVHVAMNTLDLSLFTAQHPDVEELEAAARADHDGPLVAFVDPKDGLRKGSVRALRVLGRDRTWTIEAGFEGSTGEPARARRIGELRVEDRAGRLVVVGEGMAVDLVEVVCSRSLSEIAVNGLELLARAPHTPRLTIDRLVVARESWTVPAATLTFAGHEAELARFADARAWAAGLGLPRFVYVKSPLEVKPVYVDLASPLAVNVLARLVRRANEHPGGGVELRISEMLPSFEDTWLPDAEGQRYTSELRLVLVDAGR